MSKEHRELVHSGRGSWDLPVGVTHHFNKDLLPDGRSLTKPGQHRIKQPECVELIMLMIDGALMHHGGAR